MASQPCTENYVFNSSKIGENRENGYWLCNEGQPFKKVQSENF